MNFFKQFYRSLFDLSWLYERRGGIKKGLSYFFILIFALTLVAGTFMSIGLVAFYGLAKAGFSDKVPDFQADIKDGRLSVTKLEQPYEFEYLDGKSGKDDSRRFFIRIDTTDAATGTPAMEKYVKNDTDTVLYITSNYFIFYAGPKNGQITINKFSNFPNVTFTKDSVKQKIEKARGLLFPAILIIFLGLYLFTAASNMAVVAFWSLVLWVISLLTKRSWKYGELFAVGLFAITLPIVAGLFSALFGVSSVFVRIAVFMALMLAVFLKFGQGSAPAPKAEGDKPAEPK